MKSYFATTVALAISLSTGLARAGTPEDDLKVVKRAVQSEPPAGASPMRPDDEPALALKPGSSPRWLRVRVTERGGKRVRVNVPLAFARSLSDWPIEIGCRGYGSERRCSRIRLSEVLASLEKGQSLVEIDDDGTNVRVWVE